MTIVVTVAIGLGVVAVIFTMLNTFLFRVNRVPNIGEIYGVERPRQADDSRTLLTRPRFEALRSETSVFSDVFAAVQEIDLPVNSRVMDVSLVSGNFFNVVGVDPVMGRALNTGDDSRAGGNPVLVLSDKGRRRRFNRAPDVLGKTVLVHGAPFEIVGVMPEGLRELKGRRAEFWAPLARLADFKPDQPGLQDRIGVGINRRLKPGLSMPSAPRNSRRGTRTSRRQLSMNGP